MSGSAKPYYDAEYALRFVMENGGTYDFFGSKLTLPTEARFARIEDVESYVKRVYEFLELGTPPKVVQRRGETKAHYSPGTRSIHVPCLTNWAMREIVVLHEIAHDLTPFKESHGNEFCSAFVWLLTKCIGYEAGLILAAEYGERGIQITPFVI